MSPFEFGATDIVTERGEEGVARIKELTNGVGADSVLECVGTEESMTQAIRSTRPGGSVERIYRTFHINVVAVPEEANDPRRYLVVEITPRWQEKFGLNASKLT